MATTNENEVAAMYTDLNKVVAVLDYDKAFKLSNRILQKFPEEFTAFHCKIVSLIHLEKHEDCLHQLRKNPNFASNLLFEKAYCEYRLNRTKDSLATLESADQNDLRIQELLAQVLYRLDRFDEAYVRYRHINRESQDDYGEERLTNMAAVVAALQLWGNTTVDALDIPESTHDIKYNMACYLLGRGMYEEALDKLKEAEALLRETLADDADVTEDEINDETAVIRSQMAYIHHVLKHTEEANQIYHGVMKQRPNDSACVAVVANNIVCLNRDQNVFDSRKRIKMATADNVKHRLLQGQRRAITINQCLFYLYTNQSELCRTTTNQLLDDNPDNDRPALIYAALLVKERQVSKAIQFLEEYCTTHESLPAQMTLAQLHLSQGAVSNCCQQLRRLPDECSMQPGVLGALVTLYENTEDMDAANECLQQGIDWHRSNKSGSECYARLLTASAKLLLRHGQAEEAAGRYEELRKLQPNNQRILARLIHAYTQFDKTRAEKASKSLKHEDTLPDSEVDALETAFLFGAKYMKRKDKIEATPKPATAASGVPAKRNKKHKKKNKLPKNIDPSAPLDPERWVPRRERSYFRGKKKDKRGNMMRGPQGQTTGGGDLDMGARSAASNASGPATSDPSSPQAEGGKQRPASSSQQSRPGTSGGGRQQNKKKKKGGRW